MSDWVAAVVGLLAGGALLVLAAVLVLSLPVIAARAAQVLARREWVPVTYNLRSLGRRKVTTASTFAVLALVVFVLTAIMMLAQGIAHTLTSTGQPANVKVVRNTSLSEWTSWISEVQMKLFGVMAGVARDEAGSPLVSGEMVVLIWASRAGASDPDDGANLTVRGVHPVAFEVHPMMLRAGRMFDTGRNEIVIGQGLTGRFAGAELGGTMSFADREWSVVGIADHGGSAHDSEVWGDVEVMRPIFRRNYSTVTLTLSDRSELAAFSAALASNPEQSELVAKRESEYWKAFSESYVGFVTLLGAAVGLIFSFGAILGALNTMYAQVTARTRELGTLRAIGYKPRAILISLVFESVLLSLLAGSVGLLGASLLSQATFTLTTVQTLTEITYGFHLSPGVALSSLGFAAAMGYAGGLFPAWRAAQMPIVNAVRAD